MRAGSVHDERIQRCRRVFRRYPQIVSAFTRYPGLFNGVEALRILDGLIIGGELTLEGEIDERDDLALAYFFARFAREPDYFTHCYSLMDLALNANHYGRLFDYLCEHDQLQPLDQHYFYLIMLALDTRSLLTLESFNYYFYFLTHSARNFLPSLFDNIISTGFPIGIVHSYLSTVSKEQCLAILGKISERNLFILYKFINSEHANGLSETDLRVFLTPENLEQLDLLYCLAKNLNVVQHKEFEINYFQELGNIAWDGDRNNTMSYLQNQVSKGLKLFCGEIYDFSLFASKEEDSDGNSEAQFLAENRESIYRCCIILNISIYDLIRNDCISSRNNCLLKLTEKGASLLRYLNHYNHFLATPKINFLNMLWQFSSSEIEYINSIGEELFRMAKNDRVVAEKIAVDIFKEAFQSRFPIKNDTSSYVAFFRYFKDQLNVPLIAPGQRHDAFFSPPAAPASQASTPTGLGYSNASTPPRSPVSPAPFA